MSTLLDEAIQRFKLASPTKARKLTKSGFIRVNNTIVTRPDYSCLSQDQITLATHSERKQSKLPFEVLFEDEYLLIIIKPSGITSEEIHEKLRQHFAKIYLTHRLDREVSGAMIFAKSYSIEKQLEHGWSNNSKIYLAVTEAVPKEQSGTIQSWLSETKDLRVYSGPKTENSKLAITHYRLLKTSNNRALVEIQLETGRKHQIRVTLADLGCPIVGDTKYGARSKLKGRIALHAVRLALDHPVTGQRLEVSAPVPDCIKI